MKHILFYLPDLNVGGAERVTVNIIKQLDKKHFTVTLVCVNKRGTLIGSVPEWVEVVNLNSKKTLYSIYKLRNLILKIQPDIIFSTLFHTHIAIYLALLGVSKKPKIILRSPNSPKLSIKNNQLSILMRLLLQISYKKAYRIIAQTPEMKKEIHKYHKVGLDKIDTIINPLDKTQIDLSIKYSKNPFDDTYINVVAAGRLTEQKAFDILIKAFKKVVNTNSLYKLYIIGDGEDKDYLLNIIESLNLKNNVYLLGFMENPYPFFYYSDLYVLSSRWEGLPNTLLENLYLKKPIVATKCIPFISKLIKNGENGLLVNVNNTKELSNAILNFDTINTSYTNITVTNQDFVTYFKKII